MPRRRRRKRMSSQPLRWTCRERVLGFESGPLIMGILNVTPDSFSDGGAYDDPGRAVDRALEMVAQGADLIDIGGESTRPGAVPVSSAEERRRVVPVIAAIRRQAASAAVSIDTMKADVARAALEAGACTINDVSALTHDPAMAGLAAETGAGVILMHMQGEPRTMQRRPVYGNVVEDVLGYLAQRMEALTLAGVAREAMAVDPGIGFGKTLEHNLELLRNMRRFHTLGRPVVIGLSRKRMLGAVTGRDVDQRLAASLAGLVWSALQGAQVMRVHDVTESRDALALIRALCAKTADETDVE